MRAPQFGPGNRRVRWTGYPSHVFCKLTRNRCLICPILCELDLWWGLLRPGNIVSSRNQDQRTRTAIFRTASFQHQADNRYVLIWLFSLQSYGKHEKRFSGPFLHWRPRETAFHLETRASGSPAPILENRHSGSFFNEFESVQMSKQVMCGQIISESTY